MPKVDFDMSFDPRHDLLYENPAPDAKERRAALAFLRRAARKFRGEANLRLLEGAVLCSLGCWDEARRALERAPSGLWSELWRFQAAAREALVKKDVDRMERAVKLAAALERAHPDAFYLYAWRAKLFTGFDLHPEALADLDRAIALKPDFGWGYAEKADIHTTRGRLAPALEAGDRLIALYPDRGWAYTLRGRSYGKCGRGREALADLERGIAMGPVLGPMLAWRGEARRQAGDLAGAMADFNAAARREPLYPLTYLWRGAAHLAAGRLARAIADLTRALRLDPWNLLACAWRGEARLKLGRLREAIADFDAFYPSSPRETWMGGAQAFWKDLDALTLRRQDPLARALCGRFLLENPLVSADAAWEELDRAARARPKDAWCRAWRAQAARRRGLIKEALGDLDAAIRLKPGWSWAWAWRGQLRLELGDAAGALRDLDRSLARHPLAGEVHFSRAEALEKLGDAAEAVRARRRAAGLGYRAHDPSRAELAEAAR